MQDPSSARPRLDGAGSDDEGPFAHGADDHVAVYEAAARRMRASWESLSHAGLPVEAAASPADPAEAEAAPEGPAPEPFAPSAPESAAQPEAPLAIASPAHWESGPIAVGGCVLPEVPAAAEPMAAAPTAPVEAFGPHDPLPGHVAAPYGAPAQPVPFSVHGSPDATLSLPAQPAAVGHDTDPGGYDALEAPPARRNTLLLAAAALAAAVAGFSLVSMQKPARPGATETASRPTPAQAAPARTEPPAADLQRGPGVRVPSAQPAPATPVASAHDVPSRAPEPLAAAGTGSTPAARLSPPKHGKSAKPGAPAKTAARADAKPVGAAKTAAKATKAMPAKVAAKPAPSKPAQAAKPSSASKPAQSAKAPSSGPKLISDNPYR